MNEALSQSLFKAYATKRSTRVCASCGATQADRPIVRFRLAVALDKSTQRGAGGMNLCEPCWRRMRTVEKKPKRRSPKSGVLKE